MKTAAERPTTSIRALLPCRVLSIGLLAVLAPAVGCKARKAASPPPAAVAVDTTPSEEVPVPPPVAMAVAAAPVEEYRPACDQYQLTDNGAGALRIGDARDFVSTKCRVLTDSSAQEGEGDVRSNMVVGVNGSRLVVEIADERVYRLAVTDSLFRTTDGLGPGVAVTRLLDMPGAVVLEGVHDLSIVVDAHCGLYFRVTKPATLPENGTRWSDFLRSQPPGTPVERVVVRGCRAPAS
jgi:hypothetical protein